MPDMTVTWPDAVSVDKHWGVQNVGDSTEVMFDAAAESGGKFKVVPSLSHNLYVSAYAGAVPYWSTDDVDGLLDGYAEVADEIVVPKKRVKKAV